MKINKHVFRDALMAVGYDNEKAYSFKELHRDDRKKLTEMYPEPKVVSGGLNNFNKYSGLMLNVILYQR